MGIPFGINFGGGRGMMPGYGGMFRGMGGPQQQAYGNIVSDIGGGLKGFWNDLGKGEYGGMNRAMLILGALGGVGEWQNQKANRKLAEKELAETKRMNDDAIAERERRRKAWNDWIERNSKWSSGG